MRYRVNEHMKEQSGGQNSILRRRKDQLLTFGVLTRAGALHVSNGGNDPLRDQARIPTPLNYDNEGTEKASPESEQLLHRLFYLVDALYDKGCRHFQDFLPHT